jgi:hypothetical protein
MESEEQSERDASEGRESFGSAVLTLLASGPDGPSEEAGQGVVAGGGRRSRLVERPAVERDDAANDPEDVARLHPGVPVPGRMPEAVGHLEDLVTGRRPAAGRDSMERGQPGGR